MKTCIYCGQTKSDEEFSLEHIWPDALGGDSLPDFWQTDDVCGRCNSMSGLFVDGSFIKGWFGSAERATGARDYISLGDPSSVVLPLHYMGQLANTARNGEIGEYWIGPCGESIVHIRPDDENANWTTYAGGYPPQSKKTSTAGRVYMVFTSTQEFWVKVALASVRAHFKKAKRFVVTPGFPDVFMGTCRVDLSDAVQAQDMNLIGKVFDAARQQKYVHVRTPIAVDSDSRWLAKLGLAAGYKTFGEPFLATTDGVHLQKAFRESDQTQREKIPIRGTGYLADARLQSIGKHLQWAGGWVLMLQVLDGRLVFTIVTPSATTMTIVISEDRSLTSSLDSSFSDGLVWVVVPALGRSAGPLSLPDYLAHGRGIQYSELRDIENKRIDPASLPPR